MTIPSHVVTAIQYGIEWIRNRVEVQLTDFGQELDDPLELTIIREVIGRFYKRADEADFRDFATKIITECKAKRGDYEI